MLPQICARESDRRRRREVTHDETRVIRAHTQQRLPYVQTRTRGTRRAKKEAQEGGGERREESESERAVVRGESRGRRKRGGGRERENRGWPAVALLCVG